MKGGGRSVCRSPRHMQCIARTRRWALGTTGTELPAGNELERAMPLVLAQARPTLQGWRNPGRVRNGIEQVEHSHESARRQH